MAKKGPPYDDDPECKYVVIESPFPGNKTGKARDEIYWNWLASWVYYMTGKVERVIEELVIFSVDKREEVIVKLPQDLDTTPFLGVHVWQEVFKGGAPADKDRLSYVFEYNYRKCGEPESHNWLAHYANGGEPPERIKWPVKFPYPRAHWATVRGRNCADLILPLPQTRQRTPTPPPPPPQPEPSPNLFQPYEAPAHLDHARAANLDVDQEENANAKIKLEVDVVLPGRFFVDKRDPYEEEDAALKLVKQELIDDTLIVKSERSIKGEPSEEIVKPEESISTDYQPPSEAFVAAFQRLERTRGHEAATQSDRVSNQEMPGATMKHERAPAPLPSEAFLAAFQRLERCRAVQAGQSVTPDSGAAQVSSLTQLTPTPERARSETVATDRSPDHARSETYTPGPRVKPEPEEDRLSPHSISSSHLLPTRRQDPRLAARRVTVKPEPRDAVLPPAPVRDRAAARIKREPQELRMHASSDSRTAHTNVALQSRATNDTRTRDPRQRGKLPSLKRINREDDAGSAKRVKTEND